MGLEEERLKRLGKEAIALEEDRDLRTGGTEARGTEARGTSGTGAEFADGSTYPLSVRSVSQIVVGVKNIADPNIPVPQATAYPRLTDREPHARAFSDPDGSPAQHLQT
uniref:Uncharacterized protein n=1 Tax=Amorphochlora amoebiformis TaxID=1561963 RepID=A0A7S0CUX7_9EUKA|mmetsp:Transcript_14204/g.22518  ORF Transcript_14204/g.22518 Transcript_14204/m.22518 type:complete len:109 (+) Transcript_14204:209-535(+)